MDFVPYHSGSAGPLREPEPVFLDGMMRARAFLAAPVDKFYVKLRTQSYRPNQRSGGKKWNPISGHWFASNSFLPVHWMIGTASFIEGKDKNWAFTYTAT